MNPIGDSLFIYAECYVVDQNLDDSNRESAGAGAGKADDPEERDV
jgi:hypothetical protein